MFLPLLPLPPSLSRPARPPARRDGATAEYGVGGHNPRTSALPRALSALRRPPRRLRRIPPEEHSPWPQEEGHRRSQTDWDRRPTPQIHRRLASEILKEPLRRRVGLWQQGSSTPSGSDVVASVARCFHQLRPSSMISVRTDVKNAFNSGDRRWIIRVLETYFPEFGPLVRALYEGPTDLVFTDPFRAVHHVEGQKGVTQ